MEIKNISGDRWNTNPYDIDLEMTEQSHETMNEATCQVTTFCTRTCTCICHTYGVGTACHPQCK